MQHEPNGTWYSGQGGPHISNATRAAELQKNKSKYRHRVKFNKLLNFLLGRPKEQAYADALGDHKKAREASKVLTRIKREP